MTISESQMVNMQAEDSIREHARRQREETLDARSEAFTHGASDTEVEWRPLSPEAAHRIRHGVQAPSLTPRHDQEQNGWISGQVFTRERGAESYSADAIARRPVKYQFEGPAHYYRPADGSEVFDYELHSVPEGALAGLVSIPEGWTLLHLDRVRWAPGHPVRYDGNEAPQEPPAQRRKWFRR